MTASRAEVLKALDQVIDPELRRPVTELDMVRDLELHDGVVALTIVLTIAGCPLRDSFEQQVDQALAGVAGVTGVELSFDVMTPEERAGADAEAPRRCAGARRRDPPAARLPCASPSRAARAASGSRRSPRISPSRSRSSVTASACSTPTSTATRFRTSSASTRRPVAVDEMIVPPVKDGLKLMSIGFFLETSNEPVMWRGPMLHRALEQFLTDVHWGEIDTLVVDMPPGTGDVSISLGQLLPRAEVVVVTTPQKLAQDVAARAAAMARKTNMRLLGVIENMSGDVFGSGGGEELADDLGVPLLGTVPLDPCCASRATPARRSSRRSPTPSRRRRSWRSRRRSRRSAARRAGASSSRFRSSDELAEGDRPGGVRARAQGQASRVAQAARATTRPGIRPARVSGIRAGTPT